MITRRLSQDALQRRFDAMERRKKYLIVLHDGRVLSGVKFFPNQQVAEQRAAAEHGILLTYRDKLPDGLNEWRVDVYGPTGELEQQVPSGITAKSLGYWWQSEGIKLMERGEIKGKKLKFYRGYDETTPLHYKASDPPFTHPVPQLLAKTA